MEYISIMDILDPLMQAARMTALVTGVLVFIDSLSVILYHYGLYERRPLHDEQALSVSIAWLFLGMFGAAAGGLLLTLPTGWSLASSFGSSVKAGSICLLWMALALAFTTRAASGSPKKNYIWLTSFAIFFSFLVIASVN